MPFDPMKPSGSANLVFYFRYFWQNAFRRDINDPAGRALADAAPYVGGGYLSIQSDHHGDMQFFAINAANG